MYNGPSRNNSTTTNHMDYRTGSRGSHLLDNTFGELDCNLATVGMGNGCLY